MIKDYKKSTLWETSETWWISVPTFPIFFHKWWSNELHFLSPWAAGWWKASRRASRNSVALRCEMMRAKIGTSPVQNGRIQYTGYSGDSLLCFKTQEPGLKYQEHVYYSELIVSRLLKFEYDTSFRHQIIVARRVSLISGDMQSSERYQIVPAQIVRSPIISQ